MSRLAGSNYANHAQQENRNAGLDMQYRCTSSYKGCSYEGFVLPILTQIQVHHSFPQRLHSSSFTLNKLVASERQYIIAREFYELCQERNNDSDCDISCCWRKRKLGVPLNVEATENAHLTEPFLSSNSNSAYLDA